MTDTLARLHATILSRRGADASTSYTASLFARGRARIAQKLGEEAVEAVIAAIGDDREKLIGEAADLLFHLHVLLADMEIDPAQVMAELDRREGISGLEEKRSEEHTSELQSLMRISYAVFCLKKKKN